MLFQSQLYSMCCICHASSVSGMSSFISILSDVPCVLMTFTFISHSIFALRHSSCSFPLAGSLAVMLKNHSVPAGGSSKISPVLPTYFTPKKGHHYFSLSLHCSVSCLLLIYNTKHRLISLSTETIIIIKKSFSLSHVFFRVYSIVPSKLH